MRSVASRGRRSPSTLLLFAALLIAAGCATTKPTRPSPSPSPPSPPPVAPEERTHAIHVVEAGQTLFRIAWVYGVDESLLARVNGIDDPTALRVGQELIIPGATATLEVPAYPAPLPPRGRSASAGPRLEEWRLPPSAPEGGAWSWPIDGRYSSGFGAPRRSHRHSGIDVVAPAGTPIRAAREGEVIFAGRRGDYGQLVILDHGDGWSSRYAHASKVLVAVGDRVRRGEEIARAGRTGRATTDHLHFEIRHAGVALDPLRYLPPPGALSSAGAAPLGGAGGADPGEDDDGERAPR